ncbi:complement component 1 Q subcomponent-binding protein, mitochondrial-like [Ptychodera flava]|uniref:complement component 1 Q subcomponent-binding protein, mitochondrial-like n=1 Tax=Ptychodera flava TaxID=63121 RepID=UPI003969C775
MAFSIARSASRLLCHTRHINASSIGSKFLLASTQRGQTSRAFARSMWYMSGSNSKCNDGSTITMMQEVQKASIKVGWAQRCSCCGLHTEGDKELAKYLQEEIQMEKDSHEKLPKLEGYDVSMDGANAQLTKSDSGEIVKVSFNVNHSVEFEANPEKEEEDSGAMRSYPNFQVEISKSGKPTVAVRCRFINDEVDDEEPQEGSEEDLFLIDEVVIHEGDTNEKTYIMGSEVMDGELYDMMMNMLDERGINNNFAEKLSDFASSMEHSLYISFLEKLKSIASS